MEGSKLTFVPDYFINVVKSSQQEKKNNALALTSVKSFLSLSSNTSTASDTTYLPNIHNGDSLICSIAYMNVQDYKYFHTVILHI